MFVQRNSVNSGQDGTEWPILNFGNWQLWEDEALEDDTHIFFNQHHCIFLQNSFSLKVSLFFF